MKKLLLCALALVVCCCVPVAASAQATGIAFSWTNAAQNATIPACSSTVTTSCLSSYTLSDATTTPAVVVSSTISPTATSYSLTPLPAALPASRTYSLVLNYKDAIGTAKTTTAVTCLVVIPFVVFGPSAFTGKAQ